MSAMPILPATLSLAADGTPCSPRFDDVYHTADGGPEQARHVYLTGNGLPAAWRGHDTYSILETGFGLGLNFLVTWAAWRADPQRCPRLHFVSVEKFPFRREDLQRLHARWPDFADLSAGLLAQWPPLTAGMHRLHFDDGAVTLTLVFGDAAEQLSRLSGRFNAFYLDGFAPAKNPDMWTPELFRSLSRLARPDATLATYAAAGFVRRGLNACGFAVVRHDGYGGKLHMLAGPYLHREPLRAPVWPARQALVIGAGMAGAAAAERLASRGWQVTVLEREAAIATRSSGNHAGVLLPVLSADDNLQSRLARAGYLYTLRHLAALPGLRDWHQDGVLQLARDEAQAALQRRIVDSGYPDDYVQWLDRDAASARAGAAVTSSGWWFPAAAWVHPPAWCAAALARHPELIRVHTGVDVAALARDDEGQWIARDSQGSELARAPVVVIATATSTLAQTAHLPLTRGRRVVTLLPAAAVALADTVLCRNAYLTPAFRGLRALGATAAPPDSEAAPQWHALNLAKLEAMLPGASAGIDPAQLDGRGCDRPTSPDRLPLVGAVDIAGTRTNVRLDRIARQPGLYCALGYGARGLAWSALAGELLASQICGEPLPVEKDLVDACDPARFAWRAGRTATGTD